MCWYIFRPHFDIGSGLNCDITAILIYFCIHVSNASAHWSPNGKYFKIRFQNLAKEEAEIEATLEKMLKNEDETEDKATKSSGKDNSTPPKEHVKNHN